MGKAGVHLSYMPQLDGLRGIAVILVVVHHLLVGVGFGGWIGIDVFFVLSGYLITSLLRVELEQTGRIHFRKFYLRRLLRLYPPLLFAVAVLLPFGALLYPSFWNLFASSAIALTYTTNIVAVVLGQTVGPWGHTWTLSMEEQFYLIWPVALLVALSAGLRGRRLAVVALVVGTAWLALGAATYAPGSPSSFNPLTNGGPLLIGCALGVSGGWERTARRVAVGAAGVLLVLLGVLLASSEALGGIGEVPATFGTLLLLAHLVAGRSWITRPLEIAPLVHVGKISYELYLWHFPILVILMKTPLDPVSTGIVTATASLAFAELSSRVVSRPLTRWARPKLERIRQANPRRADAFAQARRPRPDSTTAA